MLHIYEVVPPGFRMLRPGEAALDTDQLAFIGNKLCWLREENMHMTEYERMTRLLEMSWVMRGEIVPCLVGPPGIGKTAAVREHAAKHGSKVVKIVASRCVPSETVGMTMPDHEHRSMDIYNSRQLSSLQDGDILFLDELLEADQMVLSTLLTVIESREMADGTPLPDIQIVAATNDTIPPEQLKGNIRQRFMFQRFKIDMIGTHDYIMRKTGMDVSRRLLDRLADKGNDYNFLTPRSLTKLCLWMDSVPKSKALELAEVMNNIWGCTIGSEIWKARKERDESENKPEQQVRKAVSNLVPQEMAESAEFRDSTMTELLELLQSLPDWEEISRTLSELEIEESEEEEIDVQF